MQDSTYTSLWCTDGALLLAFFPASQHAENQFAENQKSKVPRAYKSYNVSLKTGYA